MSLRAVTLAISDLATGRSLGLALICPEARYASSAYRMAERLDRRNLTPSQWKAIEGDLRVGLPSGPLESSSAVVEVLLDANRRRSTIVQYLNVLPVDMERPEAPWRPADNRPVEIRSVEDAFRNITADRRFTATVMAWFGFLALLIGAAGAYGVIASIVAQRTREIGVRVAMGATTRQVIRDVLFQTVRYVVAGLVVGLPVAFAVSRMFRGLLFEVKNTDWSIYAVVTGGLLVVGLAAAVVPALRAAQVDPLVALRSE